MLLLANALEVVIGRYLVHANGSYIVVPDANGKLPVQEKKRFPLIDAVVVALLSVLFLLLHTIRFMSRSIFNPIQGMQEAWNAGRNCKYISNPYLKVAFGLALVAFSLFCTIAAFTFLAGLPAIHVGITATATAISSLPGIGALLSGAGVLAANILSTVFWAVPAICQYLAAAATAVPALLGLGAIMGLLLPTIGSQIKPSIERFEGRWYYPKRHDSKSESMKSFSQTYIQINQTIGISPAAQASPSPTTKEQQNVSPPGTLAPQKAYVPYIFASDPTPSEEEYDASPRQFSPFDSFNF